MKLYGGNKSKRYKIDRKASKKHKRYKKRIFYLFLAFVLVFGVVNISQHILKTIGKALSSDDLPDNVKLVTIFEDDSKTFSEIEKQILIEEEAEEIVEEETSKIIEEEITEEVIEEQSHEEKRIREFCAIYAVDADKVYQRLQELTDNFSSDEYLNGHTIPKVRFKGKQPITENKDLLLLMAVRCAKQTPAQLGFKENELETGEEYISPLDDTHTIAYFASIMKRNPAKDYGIMIAECQLSTGYYVSHNNPGNLKFEGEWWHFPSITEGILETMFEVLKYEQNGYDTLESMARKWEGTDNWPEWLSNAQGAYNKAMANYDELFSLEGLVEEVENSFGNRR